MPTFDLVLVGFGNVGRRFVRLLEERRDELNRRQEVDWRIVGIATARHGSVMNLDGIDAMKAAAHVESRGRLDDPGFGFGVHVASGADFIQQAARLSRAAEAGRHGDLDRHAGAHRPVVVETTVLDVRGGQPATDHVRAALLEGIEDAGQCGRLNPDSGIGYLDDREAVLAGDVVAVGARLMGEPQRRLGADRIIQLPRGAGRTWRAARQTGLRRAPPGSIRNPGERVRPLRRCGDRFGPDAPRRFSHRFARPILATDSVGDGSGIGLVRRTGRAEPGPGDDGLGSAR